MRLLGLFFAAFCLLAPLTGYAQTRLTEEQRAQMRQHLQNMTPEQRDALTAQAKTKWQSLSSDEQAALKAKAKDKFDQMTPEQKAALRERFKNSRARRTQSAE